MRIADFTKQHISLRSFLKGASFGIGIPVLGGVLAAGGGTSTQDTHAMIHPLHLRGLPHAGQNFAPACGSAPHFRHTARPGAATPYVATACTPSNMRCTGRCESACSTLIASLLRSGRCASTW